MLLCYDTNNKFLGKSAKKFALKFDDSTNIHNATSVFSSIQGVISISLMKADQEVEVKFKNLHTSDGNKSNVSVKVAFQPKMELDKSKSNIGEGFKTIATRLKNDIFSTLNDNLYGEVLKYTTFLYINDKEDKEDKNGKLKELCKIIADKTLTNNLKRNFTLKIPIGFHMFEAQCTVTQSNC
jgi:hypothetical protein